MTKEEVWKRCLEFKNNGKKPNSGMWFNQNQFRLEIVASPPHEFWVTLDLLFNYGEMKDDVLIAAICDHMEPIRTMLLDFFYSGWDLKYYIEKGVRPTRGF